MKTKYLIPIIALSIATSAASCESCNKKHAPDSTAETYADTTSVTTNADTTATNTSVGANDQASSGAASAGSSSKSTSSAAKNKDASKSGYGAPDGTDAENNDGDQYTRNDQKPQPTGPPIK